MATSEVAICNSAIARVGGARLVSLNDANPRGYLFKEMYPVLRDDLLSSHPWGFATKRAAPSPIVEPPGSLYQYRFQLPADYLRIISMEPPTQRWSIENGYLVTDFADPVFKYIARIEDVSKFPAYFAETLALKLAAATSYSLVQSVTLTEKLEREYQNQLRMARSYNAQEASTERVYADTWLASWYSGT